MSATPDITENEGTPSPRGKHASARHRASIFSRPLYTRRATSLFSVLLNTLVGKSQFSRRYRRAIYRRISS